jgi:sugar phosphate isomerase/epimerase
MILGAKHRVEPATMPLVHKLLQVFDYLEIFYHTPHLPAKALEAYSSPWVVHCPRHRPQINVVGNQGLDAVKQSLQFAGAIGARYAILHAGFSNPTRDVDMVIRQAIPVFRELTAYAQRWQVQLLVENVYPITPEGTRSVGCDRVELEPLITEAQCGFCLDFPHAVCAAVTAQQSPQEFIAQLMTLQPVMCHLYDGWQGLHYDQHLPLGEGNLDIPMFLSFVTNQYVTLEVAPPTFANFVASHRYLQQLAALL